MPVVHALAQGRKVDDAETLRDGLGPHERCRRSRRAKSPLARWFAPIASAVLLCHSRVAFAEAPSIEKDPTKIEWLLAGTAVWLGTGAAPIEVPLGCEGKQGTRLRREVFVACADRPEVRVVSLDAQRVVRHVSIDRIAEAIYVRDGRVMVSVVSTFELATRPSTAADPAATVPAPPPVDPRIVEIDEVIAPPRADGTTELSFSMAALASVRRAGEGPPARSRSCIGFVCRSRFASRLPTPWSSMASARSGSDLWRVWSRTTRGSSRWASAPGRPRCPCHRGGTILASSFRCSSGRARATGSRWTFVGRRTRANFSYISASERSRAFPCRPGRASKFPVRTRPFTRRASVSTRGAA